MSQHNLPQQVLEEVHRNFPGYPVRIEQLGDNPSGCAIGVYGVPAEQVRTVKDFIFNLDETYCGGTATEILPLVRNREVTEQHYPEMALKAAMIRIATSVLSEGGECQWQYSPQKNDVATSAAEEEYALAA